LTKVFAGSFRNFRKRFANHEAALQNLVSINFRIFRNFRRPFLTFDGVGLPALLAIRGRRYDAPAHPPSEGISNHRRGLTWR
jgi:hypothetical protein